MGPIFLYVFTSDDLDPDGVAEVVGDLHPDGKLEAGWTVVAIEGEIEEGEAQASGFLCVHDAEDKAYMCDEGTIRPLAVPASQLQIAIDRS
jgi:hypothetical protein